jgi:glutathione-regulated potassium-efflux system ancillary protein KefG
MRVLVLFAHPALQKSRIHRRLIPAAHGVDGVTFHDLYEAYPDFHIHVRREQELLRRHDVIVWQHPFYWYSCPALLKEWQDLVLEHGFAYGRNGTALRGKVALNVTTTGGPEEAYRPGGFNRFTMRQLLVPFEQTAHLCGLRYLAPYVVHGTHLLDPERDLGDYVDGYRRLLVALRDERLDLDRAASVSHLQPRFDELLSSATP